MGLNIFTRGLTGGYAEEAAAADRERRQEDADADIAEITKARNAWIACRDEFARLFKHWRVDHTAILEDADAGLHDACGDLIGAIRQRHRVE
jgi:hypothetical protein